MKIKELINVGINNLKQANIEDSAIQARVLLSYVLKMKKNDLIMNCEQEVESNQKKSYIENINMIIAGTPLQYITNKQEFMKLNFYVDENVLIPQPDTEILVDEAIKILKKNVSFESMKLLDLCTGSGAIGISVAKYVENVEVWASDISNKAIQISKLNAEKNIVHKKMHFVESDMFKQIGDNSFDIIVSNPPYIKTKIIKTLDEQVQKEPHLALDGGKDGLDFYKIIADTAYKYLNPNGKLLLEIGYDQKEEVIGLLNNTNKYTNISCVKDLADNDRVIVAELKYK